jgi:hypothetical protein
MPNEMCPRCRQIRDMRLTMSTRTVVEPGGTQKRIETVSIHYTHCQQFVRSEDEHHENRSAGRSRGSSRVMNGPDGKPDPADVNRPAAPKLPDDFHGAEELEPD